MGTEPCKESSGRNDMKTLEYIETLKSNHALITQSIDQLKVTRSHLESLRSDLREQLADAYIEISGKSEHTSDCATSVSPASFPGKCDCNF